MKNDVKMLIRSISQIELEVDVFEQSPVVAGRGRFTLAIGLSSTEEAFVQVAPERALAIAKGIVQVLQANGFNCNMQGSAGLGVPVLRQH